LTAICRSANPGDHPIHPPRCGRQPSCRPQGSARPGAPARGPPPPPRAGPVTAAAPAPAPAPWPHPTEGPRSKRDPHARWPGHGSDKDNRTNGCRQRNQKRKTQNMTLVGNISQINDNFDWWENSDPLRLGFRAAAAWLSSLRPLPRSLSRSLSRSRSRSLSRSAARPHRFREGINWGEKNNNRMGQFRKWMRRGPHPLR